MGWAGNKKKEDSKLRQHNLHIEIKASTNVLGEKLDEFEIQMLEGFHMKIKKYRAVGILPHVSFQHLILTPSLLFLLNRVIGYNRF